MMAKKHFKALASAIRSQWFGDTHEEIANRASKTEFAKVVAAICAADNPAFDRARFLAACGVTE